ncbi:integrase catalytic domain-containing protein [Trichonephila inaurata madagascariensis]|uniref:Integrase catalytic domain-containing protein n=1 Tax=Trichonephila inaurata madagascariensis TaxID=2747483 RepID=A0A8X6XGT5_9ARAC|nr:integrase catalytic domain-containing protein [Trichonephila inaurata madagascariensis]
MSVEKKYGLMCRSLYNLSHPGICATKRLIQDRFVWPSMLKDIAKWIRCCIPCPRCKVRSHTVSPIQPFVSTVERFQHVHIDLLGPFLPSDGFTFLLTSIDRYTRWPEVIPVCDISAEAVAKSFIANWISRFGVPAIITTDQEGQLQSRLLYSLKQMLGIQRIRTTPYHPSSNGMVERLHHTLKQAIRCHDTKWTESLPVVLQGLRACIKEDLNASCAEMVFGKTIVLSEEFFEPSSQSPNDPSEFLLRLRETSRTLKPTPASCHSSTTCFVHTALKTCSHVFVRVEGLKPSLTAPYQGPFEVLSRTDKHFAIKKMTGPPRSALIDLSQLFC